MECNRNLDISTLAINSKKFLKIFAKILCQFKFLQYLCSRFGKEISRSIHMMVC